MITGRVFEQGYPRKVGIYERDGPLLATACFLRSETSRFPDSLQAGNPQAKEVAQRLGVPVPFGSVASYAPVCKFFRFAASAVCLA